MMRKLRSLCSRLSRSMQLKYVVAGRRGFWSVYRSSMPSGDYLLLGHFRTQAEAGRFLLGQFSRGE